MGLKMENGGDIIPPGKDLWPFSEEKRPKSEKPLEGGFSRAIQLVLSNLEETVRGVRRREYLR